MTLLAAIPTAGLSALKFSTNQTASVDSTQYLKREFTLTNLTPNTLTLDKNTPIRVPAYVNSSKVKFNTSMAKGATIAPGEDITFDVIIAKDDVLDVSIDEVEINSPQLGTGNIVSAMNFTAQVSII